MNRKRREQLRSARVFLIKASDILNTVKDQEEDALDNIPENLQGTDMYSQMEDAVSHLEDAIDNISSANDSINEVISA